MLRFKRQKPGPSVADHPLYGRVVAAIASAQAYARSHGGMIELVGISEDNRVQLRLRGSCAHCPLSGYTLRHGIENRLKELVPEIIAIEVKHG